jgi:hypothetical protein
MMHLIYNHAYLTIAITTAPPDGADMKLLTSTVRRCGSSAVGLTFYNRDTNNIVHLDEHYYICSQQNDVTALTGGDDLPLGGWNTRGW